MKQIRTQSGMKKTIVSACCSVALFGSTALANTITPDFAGVFGSTFVYDASHSSGELRTGGTDGFTIFDFNGYVGGSAVAPVGWAALPATLVGTPFGAPTIGVDDPGAFNLHFVYVGPPAIKQNTGTETFTGFSADTSLPIVLSFDTWLSRDHLLGNPGIVGDGATSPIAQGEIIVPAAVPDGGLTLSLLGLALVGLEGMRRKFRAAK